MTKRPLRQGIHSGRTRDIVSLERILLQARRGGRQLGGFSNLFRYKLLLDRGGWWVDTDVLCLSANLPENRYTFAWEEAGSIGTAILRLDKASQVAERLYAAAERTIQLKQESVAWGDIGPVLLTKCMAEESFEHQAPPSRCFYPLH
jgi:hypothetical protein